MRELKALRRIVAGCNRATEQWRGPVSFGFVAAAALWTIWFLTNPPCTIERAAAGGCHPGVLARYINHEIMTQCLLVGMAAATLKGGYDQIMLNRERKRADEAEERLNLARQQYEERLAAERQRHDALLAELREERRQRQAEMREERQQRQADRQEERQQRQAMMDTITRLLSERQNGNAPTESN